MSPLRVVVQILAPLAILLSALIAIPMIVVAFANPSGPNTAELAPLCDAGARPQELTLDQVEDEGQLRFPVGAKLCWAERTGLMNPGMEALVVLPPGTEYVPPVKTFGVLNTQKGSPGEEFATYLTSHELVDVRWASNYAEPRTYPLRWVAVGDGTMGKTFVYLAYSDG